MCRPLSGAVSSLGGAGGRSDIICFNCAAPFRERLGGRIKRLQLCRPLSGAVSLSFVWNPIGPSGTLQLCRPLSGAVRWRTPSRLTSLLPLQLCRPLSGAVRIASSMAMVRVSMLQLCRPLSGAVRIRHLPTGTRLVWLQLCRPLSGAVSSRRRRRDSLPSCGFNCAAPFRERLA